MLPTQICSIRKFPNAPPFRFRRPRDGFARARNKPLLPLAAARNGGAYGAAIFAARVLNHMAEPGPIAAVLPRPPTQTHLNSPTARTSLAVL
jgi:hypothetical protein